MNTALDRTPPDRSIPEERRTEIRRFLAEDLPAINERQDSRRGLRAGRVHLTARRGLLATAVVLVAVGLTVVPGMMSDRGSAFAVRQLPDGVLEIEMGNQFRDGDALAAELREYGIGVDIKTIPSSPSLVGQVWVHNQTGGDYIPQGMTISPDGSANPKMTIDPDVFHERVTISMHVAAASGERYTTAEEVFEPGEVLGGLHCALGQPVRAVDLVPHLNRLRLEAIWYVVHPTEDRSITQSEQVSAVPDGTVLSGYATDASTVQFNVVLDGVTLPQPENEPRLSDVPCTPQQADAWN